MIGLLKRPSQSWSSSLRKASVSSPSISNVTVLPIRTARADSWPKLFIACSTAAPCGSSTVSFGETNTMTFTGHAKERAYTTLSTLFFRKVKKVLEINWSFDPSDGRKHGRQVASRSRLEYKFAWSPRRHDPTSPEQPVRPRHPSANEWRKSDATSGE